MYTHLSFLHFFWQFYCLSRDDAVCPDRHVFLPNLDQSELPASGLVEVSTFSFHQISAFVAPKPRPAWEPLPLILSCLSGGPSPHQDGLCFLRQNRQARWRRFQGDGGKDDGFLQRQQAGGQGARRGPSLWFGIKGGSPQVRSCWNPRGILALRTELSGK